MRKSFTFIISLAIGLLSMQKVNIAKANSAQTHWKGTSQLGIVVTDGECPLVVEKEVLTFNLVDFPDYGNEDYSSTVSAEYTFKNPTDLNLDISLAFPFGTAPSYMNGFASASDTLKYNVEINGEFINSSVRYTYGSCDNFGEKDIDKIKVLHRSETVIDENSVAYIYNFKVGKGSYRIVTDNNQKSAIISNYYITRMQGTTGTELYIKCTREETNFVNVWVIGEKPEEIYLADKTESANSPRKIYPIEEKNEDVVFSSYIYQSYIDTTLQKEEYFKAIVDIITADCNSLTTADYVIGLRYFPILGWYEYDMQVGSGQTVVNKVTAPIYPDIDSYWTPPKFTYTYLLSPAKCWARFEELEIIINTSSKILKSEGFEFESVEGGYKLKLDGLPNRELTFTLCESESPQGKKRSGCYLNVETDLGVIFIVMMGLVVLRINGKKCRTAYKLINE
ncbi:MAG: hypothetical protein IKA99_02370 [Clostridia bacterium]|nr:hypothetical protein [Clostridia bacterium]